MIFSIRIVALIAALLLIRIEAFGFEFAAVLPGDNGFHQCVGFSAGRDGHHVINQFWQ